MSDLIRKQDAVTAISDLLLIQLQGKRLPTWNEVYHAIDDIPSAESERTAKVEKKGIYTDAIHTGYCGECGHHLVSPNDVYCPGCGAKLEWE